MLAMTRFFPLRAWAYPSVAPTDQPMDPNCIWNSYLQRNASCQDDLANIHIDSQLNDTLADAINSSVRNRAI